MDKKKTTDNAEKNPKPAVIEIKDVYKTFYLEGNEINVLKGVNAIILKGEFVAVMGASGSGKSTILNMIGGLDVPSKGMVKIDGIDISSVTDDELARLRGKTIGFVFQSFNLQPNMTAWENIALPMKIHEYSEEQVNKKVNELLKIVGLDTRSDHLPNQLSGGQQQRVAIARALSTDPALILADEPTGNLDSVSGKIVLELLRKINLEKKVTIVIVTHDAKIAEHADKIIKIKDGQIVN